MLEVMAVVLVAVAARPGALRVPAGTTSSCLFSSCGVGAQAPGSAGVEESRSSRGSWGSCVVAAGAMGGGDKEGDREADSSLRGPPLCLRSRGPCRTRGGDEPGCARSASSTPDKPVRRLSSPGSGSLPVQVIGTSVVRQPVLEEKAESRNAPAPRRGGVGMRGISERLPRSTRTLPWLPRWPLSTRKGS